MAIQPQPKAVPFPIKGVDQNWEYGLQPDGTTPDASNVRAYDSILGRLRGGSRPGLSKWNATQINGSNAIRNITRIKTQVVETDPSDTLIYADKNGDRYVYAFTTSAGTKTTYIDLGVGVTIKHLVRDASGNIYILHSSIGGNFVSKYDNTGTVVWTNFTITLTTVGIPVIDAVRNRLVFLFGNIFYALDLDDGSTVLTNDFGALGPSGSISGQRTCIGSDNYYYLNGGDPLYLGNEAVVWKVGGDGTIIWRWVHDTGGVSATVHTSPGTNNILIVMNHHTGTTDYGKDTTSTLALANYWIVNQDGEIQTSASVNKDSNDKPRSAYLAADGDYYIGFKSSSAEVIFVVKYNSSDDSEAWDYFIASANAGSVEFIEEDSAGTSVIIGGTRETTWEGNDAGNASIWYLNADGTSMPTWDGDTGTTVLHAGVAHTTGFLESTTAEVVAVVCDEDIKAIRGGTLATPTGGAAAVAPAQWIDSVAAFGHIFFVDGGASLDYTIGYEASDDTITTWTASTAGTLQSKMRLLALYRGRVAGAGVMSDPHNWFMSAVADPFDFDYSPATVTATQAVAGNNSTVGEIGDVITALIPVDDDIMLFGGDHTIWALTGDPAAGGTIDSVSDKLGIAFGRAWCRDPDGTLYFFGSNNDVYRLANGSVVPENMTEFRIHKYLADIDLGSNYVIMAWDYIQQGLFITVVSQDFTSTDRVIFWEKRSDSWWTGDSYPAAIGPSMVYGYDSDDVTDRALIFGSLDGYLRQTDATATDDDGTAIVSRVRFAPITLGGSRSNMVNSEFEITMGLNSSNVTFRIFTDESAENVAGESTARFSKTVVAGRNSTIRQRVGANTIQPEIYAASGRWALGSIVSSGFLGGRSRRFSR